MVISILGRDPRCTMITLDPESEEKQPALLKKVAQVHNGTAVVYGAVVVEGMLCQGDPVELLNLLTDRHHSPFDILLPPEPLRSSEQKRPLPNNTDV